MQLTLPAFLAFAACCSAAAVPSFLYTAINAVSGASPIVASAGNMVLTGEDNGSAKYYCGGHDLSFNCGAMPLSACDKAVNINLNRTDEVSYVAGSSWTSGANDCYVGSSCCSVFVAGTDEHDNPCKMSGNQMWEDYQDIRNKDKGDCGKCGIKQYPNGCQFRIDYTYDTR